MIETVWGSTEKPVSSKQLAETLACDPSIAGILYIGYPILGTADGPYPIDALLLSPQKGLVLFSLIEGREVGSYADDQDDAFNKMRAKLLQYQCLTEKRELKANIHTVTFAPAVANPSSFAGQDYPVCGKNDLIATISALSEQAGEFMAPLVAVIQSISTLRRGRHQRDPKNPASKGAKIKALEESIASLDKQQSAAVVETFPGVQRIRGLAGSGKTIVLALKVAYLHAKHPDWSIAVTFNTPSLKKQFENLITTFVFEQANQEPDWEKVRILNAWGAPGGSSRAGIYFEFCAAHGVEYLDYQSARVRFGGSRVFADTCRLALDAVQQFVPKYDAILVDEAQDFAPDFLLLCYQLLKEPKRLVYAYDELQNLGSHPLPPMEEIFGTNPDGSNRVVLHANEPGKPQQDIVLDTCYRNSRPVLTTAHALGFGIYRSQGLVQIFDNPRLWLDVGYTVAGGELADGKAVTLQRSPASSPSFLEEHSPIDDLITFEVFASEQAQTSRLVEGIAENLNGDELLPDDIIVINPGPRTTKSPVGAAREALMLKGINSNLAGISSNSGSFSESGKVTFTGIHRARGNEATMVYVINAQNCFSAYLPRNLAIARNRLFSAITRSKAWVRVLGVGPDMAALKAEFEQVKANDFKLVFDYPTDYPTEEQQKEITIVNRDMSGDEESVLEEKQATLRALVDSLARETLTLKTILLRW